MPRIKANNLTFNYDQQGQGEPLILIPFLTADHACYSFQVQEYSKHFTCISLDLRGTGESDKPAGAYTTETLADDVAGFMQALGLESAHVAGLSLGGAIAIWLAAKYPDRVRSLGLHSSWPKTDLFLKTLLQSLQATARALPNVAEMVIVALFPWCLTPELYAAKPEYVQALADFVRSRPSMPLASFIEQSNAVIGHDVEAQLSRVTAPAQITFGQFDVLTSARRFGDRLKKGIRNSELTVFENCSHAPIYENVAEFNSRTLDFLKRHTGNPARQGAGVR